MASASLISRTSTPPPSAPPLGGTARVRAPTFPPGSGNDTIDGGGGADVISAGAGNDSVVYHGTEASIDGGSGANTLVMLAAASVNLGGADQTPSYSNNITNFQNV